MYDEPFYAMQKKNATLCCERAVPTLLTCQARAAASFLFVIPAKAGIQRCGEDI
jgi:hypothetical protein